MFESNMALTAIAWRSLWRNRRRTIISIAAIGLGLSFALFMLAWAEGIYQQMINDAVRMNAGHLTIEHAEYRDAPAIDLVVNDAASVREGLEAIEGITSTKVLVLGQGVAKTGTATTAVAILGVEPAVERQSSPLAKNIVEGAYLEPADTRKIVIGTKLAERLKLKLNKKLVIASTDTTGDMTEELVRVKGIFRMGAKEIDGHIAQIPIDFARRFFGMEPQQATQIGAVVAEATLRDSIMSTYRAKLPKNAVALPWEEVMPDLANYVRLDRSSNQVFEGIIIFLCLFTIFNTILMSVLERTREFAVMLALGTRQARVRRQVLIESAMLAIMGIIAGTLFGGGWALYLQIYGLDISGLMGDEMDVSGFAMSTVTYAKLSWQLVLGLGGTVFVATMLIAALAVRRIKEIDLATVLR